MPTPFLSLHPTITDDGFRSAGSFWSNGVEYQDSD